MIWYLIPVCFANSYLEIFNDSSFLSKHIRIIFLTLLLCSCSSTDKKSEKSSTADTNSIYYYTPDENDDDYTYSSNPSSTSESEITSSKEVKNDEYSISSKSNYHVHSYKNKITKNATCTEYGEKTFYCSCGDSYTESISELGHDWIDATCSSPEKCKRCGETRGSAKNHSYGDDGKCKYCGKFGGCIINVETTLPSEFGYYSSSGTCYTKCRINSVGNFKLKYSYNPDELWYTVRVSGTSTYNYQGAHQSSRMAVGWKLYSSNNVVVKSGTVYSESVAVGESFDEEINLYYLNAGETYRLVFSNVN